MSRTLYDVTGEPWFPLLYQRWRKDTAGLTLAQQGAYLRLIIAQVDSDDGSLPKDDAILCGASGCPPAQFEEVVRPLLRAPFFHSRAAGWVNARALWCWKKKTQRSQLARERAKLRWQREKEAILEPAPMLAALQPAHAREREGEGERERTPLNPPMGGDGKQLRDQQAVVQVWEELMGPVATKNGARYSGGMDPRRIVQAVMPLLRKHGRDEVLANFRRYLGRREPQYCSPEDFVTRYVAWSKDRGVKPVPL